MRTLSPWVIVALIMAALQPPAWADAAQKSEPATIELIPGTELKRVRLAAKAAERLGIETDTVRETPVAPRRTGEGTLVRKVVPYASVIYDLHGGAWAYTSPEPLTFVRGRLSIDYIVADLAVLVDGPPAGTAVVTVGA